MAKRAASSAKSPPPELVVITGLSGSGKGTVLKCLEDLGFYSVDNLPVELFPKFAELVRDSPNIRHAALVVDIREGAALKCFPGVYARLSRMLPSTLLFLEADDNTIVRRFSETRRPHPLGTGDSVLRSVRRERRQLAPIRALAGHTINTAKFNVHELRELISEKFLGDREQSRIMVHVISFGYRYGVPLDSDLVFDVRFLPNPNYIPQFKSKRQANPSVHAGDPVLKWKDERSTGGKATAAAEPGGGRAVGGRVRGQRDEPGGVLPEAWAGFVDSGAVPEAAGAGAG